MNGDPVMRSHNQLFRGAIVATAAALAVTLAACGSGEGDPHARPAPVSATVHPTFPKLGPTLGPAVPSTSEAPKMNGEFTADPTWEQDFTTMSRLDTSVWDYDVDPATPTYNDEIQGYTTSPDNVRVEPGTGLILEAHHQDYHYPNDPEGPTYHYTSGRIDTKMNPAYQFQYGKLEATMKLPAGSGVWPAFWLLSANQPFTDALHPTDADWNQERFYLHDGEVDIMESYGNIPGMVEATLHTFHSDQEKKLQVPDDTTAFHTYGVEITPKALRFTIDGQVYQEFQKPSDNPDDWPFQNGNKFYVILNLAMGSTGGQPNPSQNTWQMVVQKVSFYDYGDDK